MKTAIALAIALAAFASSPAMAGDEGEARVVKRTYKFEWKSPFVTMSPQGMAIVREAMQRERIPSNAEQVRRARQRVLELISADRLDVDAIRKAQAEERAVAIKEHALAQEKMLRAYEKLSIADRQAFAEGMRLQEERMLHHMDRARERMKQAQERMLINREQLKREREQMRREMERVKKETGSLWIVIPPAAPVPVQAPAPVSGRRG